MNFLKKIICSSLIAVSLLSTISASAAIECEDSNVTSLRAQGSAFKSALMSSAKIANPDTMASTQQASAENALGLFGKVQNCAMLFISAGMSPGNIKKAACHLKCFTSIKKGCRFTFKEGIIRFKEGAPAYAICPAILPVVMAF